MKFYLIIPFKRRWIRSTFIVFILSLIMMGLGFWQLNKHHQRQAYIAGVIAEVEDAPFVLTGRSGDDVWNDRIFHLVRGEGEFDFARQVAIKNKFYDETMGYHLVTPFLIKGSQRAVLVDRGWVSPAEIQSPEDARKFDEPDLTTILGRIAETEESAQPSAEPQFWWYRVDVANIGRQLPYELLPFYVSLVPSESSQTAPPYRNPPKFELDSGAHLGYAIQWFLFALLSPLFYLWLVVRTDRLESMPDA